MQDLYRHLALLRVHGAVVMSAPSHVNSARLKTVEEGTDSRWKRMQQTILHPSLFIEIVDECDEVLRPDSELVYAVGEVRYDGVDSEVCSARIRVLEVVLDLAWGYRADVPEAAITWTEAHSAALLTRVFTRAPQAGNLVWLEAQRDRTVITGQDEPNLDNYTPIEGVQLLMLRGLFSFGLLANLLERRYRVHYGINELDTVYEKKRLAVPFRANDTPSHKSEFARLELVIGFTIMAYYHKGLTLEQVREARVRLSTLNTTRRVAEFSTWIANVHSNTECPRSVSDITDINIDALHKAIGTEHALIHFWLNMCLFPTELQTYPQSISTNSWHLMSGSRRIVGFSGTRDLGLLSPYATVMGHVAGHEGANGRMLSINNRVQDDQVFPVDMHEDAIESMLVILKEREVDAIIDVGALFQGRTPEQVAEHLRSELNSVSRHRGIVFHSPEGWRTLPMALHTTAQDMNTSTIPVHQCLVLYDQENTRGVDMRLRHDAFALVTVGPEVTRDTFMQAVGRLRQLDGDQRYGLIIPQTILNVLDAVSADMHNWSYAQRLMAWLLLNTDQAVQCNVVNWVEQAVYFRKTDTARRQAVLDTHGLDERSDEADGADEDVMDDLVDETTVWYIDDQDLPLALYGKHCRPETPATRALALLLEHAEHFTNNTLGSELLATMESVAKSLQPHSSTTSANTDHGFNTFVQREMQQQQEQEVVKETNTSVYAPAVDSDGERDMDPISVKNLMIHPNLLCTSNFTTSASTSSARHFFKYVGPLRWRETDDTYEILTQREAERYLENGVRLLHLHVHTTSDVTALLSVYNGFLSLGEEYRRRFVVSVTDRSALEALRYVIDQRQMAESVPHSHFEQALINARLA